MLKLLDIVTLKADDPDTGLKAGTEGTIVDVHGNHEAYTVEFVTVKSPGGWTPMG